MSTKNWIRRDSQAGPATTIKDDGLFYVPGNPYERLRKADNYILFVASVGSIFPGIQEMYNIVNHCRLTNDAGLPKNPNGEVEEIFTPAQLGRYFFSSDGTYFRSIVLNDYIFRFTNIIITITRDSDSQAFPIYKSLEFDGSFYKQWGGYNVNGTFKWSLPIKHEYQTQADGNGDNIEYQTELIFDLLGNGNVSVLGTITSGSGYTFSSVVATSSTQLIVTRRTF